MAKWGEGDPRWIVEERPDATNVNNWHWTERDASAWSKDRFKALFDGFEIKLSKANVKITEIEKCEGEASANNRKGKLIFFYEWKLVLKWTGTLNGTQDEHSGTVTIPNISEENEMDELDIQIALQADDDGGDDLKEIMHKEGRQILRKRVGEYVENLKLEFSKGMILPKKDNVKPDNIKNLTSGFNKKVNMQPVLSQVQIDNIKIDTSSIKIKEKFQCRAEDLYNALTKIEMVVAFTRGPAQLQAEKDGKFELFGGNIIGTFAELIPGQKLSRSGDISNGQLVTSQKLQ